MEFSRLLIYLKEGKVVRRHEHSFIHILLLTILTIIVFLNCSSQVPKLVAAEEEYLVVLSMDGCRWDYPQMADMPHLESVASEGVKAQSVQPVFPANTFPTHFSIATGLYPDHHGIVNNSFRDTLMDLPYSMGNRDAVENAAFYNGEPIWVTAEKQGVKAASFFWAGSEAPIKGVRPSITMRWDGSVPYETRIDSVVQWLNKPEKDRPGLIMWYMDEPDGVGHDHGPESPQTKATLEHLDSLLGVFLSKIEKLPISEKVNIIVTSDHGMSETSENRIIYLDDYLKESWTEKRGWTSFFPKPGFEDSVLSALERAPHIDAWKKEDIPDSLHYGTNPRIPPIVASRESGWSVARRYQKPDRYNGGSHGYSPYQKDMHVIFYAKGPAFKKGYVHPTFESVDLYSLMAHILKLDPAGTDGHFEAVAGMLNASHLTKK